jgi:sec-independent protein translocase protein TatA
MVLVLILLPKVKCFLFEFNIKKTIDLYLKYKNMFTFILLGILGGLGGGEILLIAMVLLLMFGGKKIPELMKGLGKGMKEFKDASNGSDKDEKDTPAKN